MNSSDTRRSEALLPERRPLPAGAWIILSASGQTRSEWRSSLARDESVTVKGSLVRSLQKFLEAELSAEQRALALQTLPAEYATRLGGIVLATETIPVHILNALTAEAAKAKGEAVEQFARRAGREGASDAVKGIYRFFALILTPAALLSKASSMWTTLYNRGQMRIENQTDRGATIKLLDFPSETAGCARITGWIERMAELTGVKNLRVQQTQCYAKGAPHCEWNVTWQ
jgi:predicted hydrocarbon binding protein